MPELPVPAMLVRRATARPVSSARASEAKISAVFTAKRTKSAAARDADVLKAVVRLNDNYAGVYGAVARVGRVAVGQPVWLRGA